MPSKFQIQLSNQRRAAWVITEYLLNCASRERLPALNWTIDNAGAQIGGTSYTYPSSKRRKEITAWATALDIQLREYPGAAATTIMGIGKDIPTSFGPATILLLCDVYDDERQAAVGDEAETHYVVPSAV